MFRALAVVDTCESLANSSEPSCPMPDLQRWMKRHGPATSGAVINCFSDQFGQLAGQRSRSFGRLLAHRFRQYAGHEGVEGNAFAGREDFQLYAHACSDGFREHCCGARSIPTLDSVSLDAHCGKTGIAALTRSNLRGYWNFSKTLLQNNGLWPKPDAGCVLFVQHLFENAHFAAVLCGSFVACAEAFSNCGVTTEGGIPRSSRSRWFA